MLLGDELIQTRAQVVIDFGCGGGEAARKLTKQSGVAELRRFTGFTVTSEEAAELVVSLDSFEQRSCAAA